MILAASLLAGCRAERTPVQPAASPPAVATIAPDVTLLACDGGAPLWVAMQDGSGPWVPVRASEAGRYEIRFADHRGGLIVVDTSGGTVRTNVLYMAGDEFASMIQRTDTLRTCTRRTASVMVAGLRTTDVARVGLGGGTRTIADNGVSQPISEVGARTVSLGAARVTQGNRADLLILRRDIPFAGPHTVLDFNGTEAIALDSVPVRITNTRGQLATVILSLMSHSVGGASLELDRVSTAGDAAMPVHRVPVASQRAGDVHVVLARTGFPEPRQVITYTEAREPVAVPLGPPLVIPVLSASGRRRPAMQVPLQDAYATAMQASWFQTPARTLSVTVSARYLGAVPAVWSLTPPDLAGVAGWDSAWMLVPGATTWQANGFGGALGSEPVASVVGRVSTFALQQGQGQVF